MEQQEPQVVPGVDNGVTDTIIELMTNPMKHYDKPRVENEIDLVAHVRDRLISVGLGDRLESCFENNRFIQDAKNRTCHAQQYNLTRYFALQLMAAQPQHDTSVERYALMYECRADQWLEVFDRVVLPTFVNCDLPIQI